MKLNLRMEGSYDGLVWLTTGLTDSSLRLQYSGSGPAFKATVAAATIDFALIRVAALLATGGNAKALFAADLVFTEQ
ncbi:MAG: hypothetical protein H6807_15225 [Planctomycetes bacterium]|nr:hypothetical protein [Planctomycetota bacterium]